MNNNKDRLNSLIKLLGKPDQIFENKTQKLDFIYKDFENLFKNLGEVQNGFTKQIPLNELEGREQYDPDMLTKNLLFGNPEEIIRKLKLYQDLGVDEFIYYASMGLGHKEQKKSLKLFIEEVMPEFC